jgi:hypothetical protein
MRLSTPLATAILSLGFVVAGCANPNRKIVDFQPTRPIPPAATVDKAGSYDLFAADTPDFPVKTIALERGAQFGFRNDGGQVVAFAQRLNTSTNKPYFEDVRIPLPGGDKVQYYWKRTPPPKK